MLSSVRPIRTLLAAAIAVAALPATAAEPAFNGTVFFGDSLTDSGYFRPLLPPATQAVTGKFTTNPALVWAEVLAHHYRTDGTPNGNGQSGDNYAVGGATVGTDIVGPLGPTPSLRSQAERYLAANGGKADGNTLYTVWGGANDLFAITNPAQAPAVIGAAVATQAGIVSGLQQAGANYVLVPNLPDIGLTPMARAGGPAAMAQYTAVSQAYNNALYTGLAQTGVNFIPLDTFTILREIVANPGAYGFRNVTDMACTSPSSIACNPTSLAAPDAFKSYVFADGVHPTQGTHEILGQYAISVLEAPRLQQVLSHSAQAIGRSRADQVSLHRSGAAADGMSWWGGIRGDMQRHDHANLYDGLAPAGLFGLDWARDGRVFGAFAGHGRMDADFGNSQGDFTQSDTTVGVFAGWYGARTWVNGQVSYSWLDYDVTRKVQLGPATREHSGSPEGSNLTAALNAGYEFGVEGGFRHGPVAGVIWQKVKIDGYEESNPSATALGYNDQDVDSTVGRLGWQARLDGAAIAPYAQLTLDHEFEDRQQASAWLQTVPGVGSYRVPGMDFDRNYATAIIGARMPLFGLQGNVGVSASTLQKDASEMTFFASFSGNF